MAWLHFSRRSAVVALGAVLMLVGGADRAASQVRLVATAADHAAEPGAVRRAARDAHGAGAAAVRDLPRPFRRRADACADFPRRRIPEHDVLAVE